LDWQVVENENENRKEKRKGILTFGSRESYFPRKMRKERNAETIRV